MYNVTDAYTRLTLWGANQKRMPWLDYSSSSITTVAVVMDTKYLSTYRAFFSIYSWVISMSSRPTGVLDAIKDEIPWVDPENIFGVFIPCKTTFANGFHDTSSNPPGLMPVRIRLPTSRDPQTCWHDVHIRALGYEPSAGCQASRIAYNTVDCWISPNHLHLSKCMLTGVNRWALWMQGEHGTLLFSLFVNSHQVYIKQT